MIKYLVISNFQVYYRHRESKVVHDSTWYTFLLKNLGIPNEGSYVLSVFLLNTKYFLTKKIFLTCKDNLTLNVYNTKEYY